MVSVSFQPIGSWPVVALAALGVTALTLWAYAPRLRTTSGRWRWIALGLRLAAVLLCLMAALRPSVVYREKQKQPASILFLSDFSTSMTFSDEVNGQRRFETARKAIADARAASKGLDENLAVRFYRFDKTLRDDPEDKGNGKTEPTGRETAIGTALLEAVGRESGTRVASVFVLSDGANNSGVAPLVAARQLKGKQIPIVTVGFGSETAGSKSKDIAVRDLVAGNGFVKNNLQLKANLLVRGFPNQTIEVELLVDGQEPPVATQRIRVPEGKELIPITGLKYVPQTPGEKKLTLRVTPREGELVKTNNEISTFIKVLKGGLNVLFVQGPHSPWEHKFLMLSIASSPDIQADLKVVRRPAGDGSGELNDDLFVSGRYDVYILSDLPADFMTQTQQALLAQSVEKGAGLIMLGGRSSFGEGGWGATAVGRVLPVTVRPGDGQVEPEGGVRFKLNPKALDSYILQVGPNAAESARIWNSLPPLSGINHLGVLKPGALLMGESDSDPPEPIMVGMEVGAGRSLAFGGETWVWYRSIFEEGRTAHRKLWRQIIFWLAHKEDQGQNEVKLTLDSRRIAVGQKLDMGVVARDEKGSPLTELTYETKVEGEEKDRDGHPYSQKIDLFTKGDEARGSFLATQSPPGVYKASVVVSRNGHEIGRDSAKFLVYTDDREMENPAADRLLLRQIALESGGESLAPEQITKFIRALKGKVYTDIETQTEKRVWDNWPFLLVFATLLVVEWWIRKRHGLV
jgi:uncharacterized membrane protein